MDEIARLRRQFLLLLVIAAGFAVLLARLLWLQLGLAEGRPAVASWAAAAVRQRVDALVLDSGRGRFLDREGRPLTGVPAQGMAVFPGALPARGLEEAALMRLADALGAGQGRLAEWLEGLRGPAFWHGDDAHGRPQALTRTQAEAIRRLALPGVYVLPFVQRYASDLEPLHVIGYVSQDPERLAALYGGRIGRRRLAPWEPLGGSGLERSLDRFLHGAGPTLAVRHRTAGGRDMAGLGLRLVRPGSGALPLMVRTTIDRRVQRAAERALDRAGVRAGAVVVLDAANADILAMVSRPSFDPGRIGLPGTDVRNHALTGFPPGSVFKTVTLAAALETGAARMSERFRCDGHYGRYGLRCWKREGHGVLDTKQAYAQSCNVAFAAMAERMDGRALADTAERLGLARRIGWHTERFADGRPLRLLMEEEAGAVFASPDDGKDGGVRTGAGIGQRDVRVTPLQAANLVVTLLNGGKVRAPRLVSEIRFADGRLVARLPPRTAPSPKGSIRRKTAAFLLEAMEAVVTEGTGSEALAHLRGKVAGKSGTAETGLSGPTRHHHWFVGYGPLDRPRYAAAVLIEDQPAGLRNRAVRVFGDLMAELLGGNLA